MGADMACVAGVIPNRQDELYGTPIPILSQILRSEALQTPPYPHIPFMERLGVLYMNTVSDPHPAFLSNQTKLKHTPAQYYKKLTHYCLTVDKYP
jgi:hypothetical protein